MSDIDDHHDNGEGRSDPIELDSKTILIQNKRFYLDVKENDRGRFLKIAEVTPGGHKNRVTMAMQLLPEFRDNLSDFVEHYISLGPANLSDNNEDYDNRRPLKTARIVSGPRRYFLDLKENVRGRYLLVLGDFIFFHKSSVFFFNFNSGYHFESPTLSFLTSKSILVSFNFLSSLANSAFIFCNLRLRSLIVLITSFLSLVFTFFILSTSVCPSGSGLLLLLLLTLRM